MNAFYASAGPRRLHIIDPQNRDVMLCSSKLFVVTPEFTVTENGTRRDNGISNFPKCKNCLKKADKLGLTEPTNDTVEPTTHVVEPLSETEFVTVAADGGKVHHAFASDGDMIPLCRQSRGIRQYTMWHRVNVPLSCSRCLGYERGRAAARAKYASAPTVDQDADQARALENAENVGRTTGTLAEHTEDPMVRTVIADLDSEELEPAEITGDDLSADTVNGVVVIPRPDAGALYVYWYTNGSTAIDGRRPAELAQIRRALVGAGYRVTPPTRGSLLVKVLMPTTAPGTGVEPRNATNPTVNAAAQGLGAAGLPLAFLTGDHDHETTVPANGFMVTDHTTDETVFVAHLADGSTRDPHTGHNPRYQLHQAAQALTEAGWVVQHSSEWTWRLWATRPTPELVGRVIAHQGGGNSPTVVHYRRNTAEHGAVCGATALSVDDSGMSNRLSAITCPECKKNLPERPPLPRRTRQGDAIDQAIARWNTPGMPRMADL